MSACSKCLSLAKLFIWLSLPTFSKRSLNEEVPVWSQFGSSFIPVWSQHSLSALLLYGYHCQHSVTGASMKKSQFGPSLVPVSSQFRPSFVPTQSQRFAFISWESVLQCCTLICSSITNAIQSLQFTASLNNIHTYYQLSCDHSGLLGCYAEW